MSLCTNGWACVFKGSRKMQIHWGALVFITSILLNILLQNYCTQSHKPYSHTSIYIHTYMYIHEYIYIYVCMYVCVNCCVQKIAYEYVCLLNTHT